MDISTTTAPAPDVPAAAIAAPIPPIRWVMVGYFFWVGIYFGALIMRSATGF